MAFLGVCVVLLAGCRVDAKVDVTVHRDGSGIIQTTIALDNDAIRRVGGLPTAAKMVPLADLKTAGWTVGEWQSRPVNGRAASITISARFADQEQLALRLKQLAGTNGIVRDPHITRDHGWFGSRDEVSMVVDLRAPESGVKTDAELVARLRDAGLDPAAIDKELSRELRDSIHLTVAFHLPGGATRTFDSANGELATVKASNSTTDYDAMVKVGIALLLLLLAGSLFLAANVGKRRDRRRRAQRGPRVDRDRAPLM